jgi:hypothetical protein
VSPDLVLPSELQAPEPVPLWRRQLLAVRDRHGLGRFLKSVLAELAKKS